MKTLELSIIIRKEGKWYSVWCPEVNVASQGKTVQDAKKNIEEALELYFEDSDAKIPKKCEIPLVSVLPVKLYGKASLALRA